MASLSNNVGSNPYLTVLSFDLNHHEYGYTAFCTKLYFRLRHGGLPYETAKGTRGQAPKGKMPYARFEKTGELMGDSSLITQRLIDDGKLEELNAGLAPEQRAADFCLRSMVDDRMYYLTVRQPPPRAAASPQLYPGEATNTHRRRSTSASSRTPRSRGTWAPLPGCPGASGMSPSSSRGDTSA